ncbi:MAG: nucleotide-diphospho-sugar transferase [Pedobacter sp.]|nr:MAG: nucleotide-diphospho-sugar transferase [Pedobacter sp.]
MSLNTPLLFIVFNRPEITQTVFNAIKQHKPKSLFFAADGPRHNHPEDADLCKATREIIKQVDWECDVKTLLNEHNLGCGLAPATAISWFFKHVEAGIILEDDCIPNASFFDYCENLIEKYRYTEKIKMICGTSYQATALESHTYYFSQYPHVWGWATWRRAWEEFSFDLQQESEEVIAKVINKTFRNRRDRELWIRNIKMIVDGLDAWDYQFMYWMWKNDGLCIVPWRNLISNIGFGDQATHTHDVNSDQSAMEQFEISEIKHPEVIKINKRADRWERNNIILSRDYQYFFNRAKSVFLRLVKTLFKKNGR